jgi:hypothetical protein
MKAGDVVLKVSGKDVTRDQTLSFWWPTPRRAPPFRWKCCAAGRP